MTAANAKYQKTEKGRAAQARWQVKNPGYYKRKAKEAREQKPEHLREIRFKHRYGMLPTRKCPKHCECCGIPFVETKTHHGACFDHNHVTGAFRGWLCNDCNVGLGRLGDCREGILRMLNYLDVAELLS